MRIFTLLAICLCLLAFQEKKADGEKPAPVIKGDLGNGRYTVNIGKQGGLKENDKLEVFDKDKKAKALLVVKEIDDDYSIVQLIEGSVNDVAIGDIVEIKSAGGAQPESPKPPEQKPPEQKPDEQKPSEKKPPEKKPAPDKSLVDKELQAKIDKAIKKGVDWLLKQQNKDSGTFDDASVFGAKKSESGKPHTHGPTVLTIYALIKSGIAPDDPAIQKALTLIKTKPPILTNPRLTEEVYIVSFLILALDAIVEKLQDEKVQTAKDKSKKNPQISQYLAWMKTLHNVLINRSSYTQYQGELTLEKDPKGKKSANPKTARVNCIAWVHAGEKGQWKWDNSCSQIVVLALAACSRNGIKIDKDIWTQIANHWLVTQWKEGKDVPRYVTDTETGDIIEGDSRDNARGWAYFTRSMWDDFYNKSLKPMQGGGLGDLGVGDGGGEDIESVGKSASEPYSAMTAAGVCSLIICHSELQDDKIYKEKLAGLVDKGIRDGIASYNEMFPIEKDKKRDKWENALFLYSLYSLERVGVMAKLRNVGKHFWYKEGAEELIGSQKSDGSWGDKGGTKFSQMFEATTDAVTDTCFALLFLKRATFEVPVQTFQQEGHKTEAGKAKW